MRELAQRIAARIEKPAASTAAVAASTLSPALTVIAVPAPRVVLPRMVAVTVTVVAEAAVDS